MGQKWNRMQTAKTQDPKDLDNGLHLHHSPSLLRPCHLLFCLSSQCIKPIPISGLWPLLFPLPRMFLLLICASLAPSQQAGPSWNDIASEYQVPRPAYQTTSTQPSCSITSLCFTFFAIFLHLLLLCLTAPPPSQHLRTWRARDLPFLFASYPISLESAWHKMKVQLTSTK